MELRLSSNCIFCNSTASRCSIKPGDKPLDDNCSKLETPFAEATQDGSDSEPRTEAGKFRKAFKLFYKLLLNEGASTSIDKLLLLSMEGNDNDDVGGGDGMKDNLKMDLEHRSCGACYRTVMNILRLQTIIEQALAELRDHFEMLKHSIVNNLDRHPTVLDPIWEPLREQLTKCLSAKLKHDMCVNEWTIGEDSNQGISSPLFGGESPCGNQEDSVVSPDNKKGNLPIQDKERAEFLPLPSLTANDVKFDNNSTTKNLPKVKSCSVKLTRLNIEDIPNLVRGFALVHHDPDKTDEGALRVPRKRTGARIKSRKDKDYLFYKVGDNHLLHKHVLIQHTPIEFICQIRSCGIRINGSDYDTFQEFKSHVKNYHKCNMTNTFERYAHGPKYICPLCQTEFMEGSDFTSHVHSEHSPPSVCVSCWKPLESTEEMGEHVKLHTVASSDSTDFSPPSNPPRKNHWIKDKQIIYSCKFCPKQFTWPAHLKEHEITHAPKHLRPHFTCPECGLKLLSKRALVGHVERKHRPDDNTKKLECHICNAKFFHRDGENYRIHMRSHTGETPWICDVCGKGFRANAQYSNHIDTVHSTEQNYQCEFCEKRFKQKPAFRTHQRKAHKGLVKELDPEERLKVTYKLEDRPGFIGPKIAYPCEYCGKIFPIRSLMTKHVNKSHTQPI